MSVVIVGTGPVTPIGIGNDDFWAAFISGKSGVHFSEGDALFCGEVSSTDVDISLKDRRFRRAAPYSRQAILSVKLAMQDAGLESIAGNSSALIMTTMHGAMNYSLDFHRAIVADGADGASPMLFSDSVQNAAAGNVSLCFGIKGPTHTMLGGPTSFLKAVRNAEELFATTDLDIIVVAASDELNALELSCYSRLGMGPLASGSGALILSRNKINSCNSGCCIRAVTSRCNPSDPIALQREVISECLQIAALQISDISLVFADCVIHCHELSNVMMKSVTPLTGEALTATASWQTIAAAQLLGRYDQQYFCEGERLMELKNILIVVEEANGVISAMILARD